MEILLVITLFIPFYIYRKSRLDKKKECLHGVRDRAVIAEAQKQLGNIRKQSQDTPFLGRFCTSGKTFRFKFYLFDALKEGPVSKGVLIKNRPRYMNGYHDPLDIADSKLFLKTISKLEEDESIVNIGAFPCEVTGEKNNFYLTQNAETQTI